MRVPKLGRRYVTYHTWKQSCGGSRDEYESQVQCVAQTAAGVQARRKRCPCKYIWNDGTKIQAYHMSNDPVPVILGFWFSRLCTQFSTHGLLNQAL